LAEKSLWAYLRKGMKGKWEHGMRVECMLNKGVADVSYYHRGNSWIELKEVKKLPARPTTGIKLGRWEDQAQRLFLIRRRGWLLVRVNYPDRCYVLFQHTDLPPDQRPYWTWGDWGKHAYYIWEHRIDFEVLGQFLGDPE